MTHATADVPTGHGSGACGPSEASPDAAQSDPSHVGFHENATEGTICRWDGEHDSGNCLGMDMDAWCTGSRLETSTTAPM